MSHPKIERIDWCDKKTAAMRTRDYHITWNYEPTKTEINFQARIVAKRTKVPMLRTDAVAMTRGGWKVSVLEENGVERVALHHQLMKKVR